MLLVEEQAHQDFALPASIVSQVVWYPTSIRLHQARSRLQELPQLLCVQQELTTLFTTSQFALLVRLDIIATVQECQYQQFAPQDHTAPLVRRVLFSALLEHTIQYLAAQASLLTA